MAPKASQPKATNLCFRTCLLVPPPVPPRKGGKLSKKKPLASSGTVAARLLRNVRAGQEGFDLNSTKVFLECLSTIDGQHSTTRACGVQALQSAKNILAARTLQQFQSRYPPEPQAKDQKIPLFTTTQLASLLMFSQLQSFFTDLNMNLNEQTTESLRWEMYIRYLLSSLRLCPWAAAEYLFVGAVPNEVYCKALNPYKQGTYLTWCSFMSASGDPQQALKGLGPNSGAGKGRLLFVIKTNEYCRAKLIPKIESSYGCLESEIIITPPSTFEVETVSCVDILTTVYLTARPPGFGFDGIWAPTDPACETEELTREEGKTVDVLPDGVEITDAYIKTVVEDFAKTLQTVGAATPANGEQKGGSEQPQKPAQQTSLKKRLTRAEVAAVAMEDNKAYEEQLEGYERNCRPVELNPEEREGAMAKGVLADEALGLHQTRILPVDTKELMQESIDEDRRASHSTPGVAKGRAKEQQPKAAGQSEYKTEQSYYNTRQPF